MSAMIERVASAIHSYAVMYSHETVGDDLRTVNRQWRVYATEQASRDKPPTVFEASFTEKAPAYALCARLNARAVIEAMREPTVGMVAAAFPCEANEIFSHEDKCLGAAACLSLSGGADVGLLEGEAVKQAAFLARDYRIMIDQALKVQP